MEKLKFYLVAICMMLLVQSCAVESNHTAVSRSGWYQDPMNPKYAMKKSHEHKTVASIKKYSNNNKD